MRDAPVLKYAAAILFSVAKPYFQKKTLCMGFLSLVLFSTRYIGICAPESSSWPCSHSSLSMSSDRKLLLFGWPSPLLGVLILSVAVVSPCLFQVLSSPFCALTTLKLSNRFVSLHLARPFCRGFRVCIFCHFVACLTVISSSNVALFVLSTRSRPRSSRPALSVSVCVGRMELAGSSVPS